MKKILLSLVTIIIFTIAGNAQVEPHAIGLRLGGGNYGSGAEISYQHAFGDANRLELDLGINSRYSASYMSIVGVYQWVWEIEQGFNWYAGPGAQLLLISNSSAVGVGGAVGMEYNFNVELETPLSISLDTRPMWNFFSGGSDMGWGLGLGIRYTF